MNQIERVAREELSPIFEMMSQAARLRFVNARADYRPGVHKTRYLSRKPPVLNIMVRTADALFVLLVMAVSFASDIGRGESFLHAGCLSVILAVVTESVISKYRVKQLTDWLWSELTFQYFSARAGDAILLDQQNAAPYSEDATFIVENLKKRYIHLRDICHASELNKHDNYFNTHYPMSTELFRSMLERDTH